MSGRSSNRLPSMKTMERYFVSANRWVLIVLLASMSVIIFTNVVMRYVTHDSLEWGEEVARYMMIWLTFLGAGSVLRLGGHIAVENLQDALPRPLAIAMRAVVACLLMGFFVFMAVYGWMYMERAKYQTTPVTQIPFSYIYAAMTVGGILLIIHFLFILRGYVIGRRFVQDENFDATSSASV